MSPSRVFRENLDRLRALLFRAVPRIGPQPNDACATALQSASSDGTARALFRAVSEAAPIGLQRTALTAR